MKKTKSITISAIFLMVGFGLGLREITRTEFLKSYFLTYIVTLLLFMIISVLMLKLTKLHPIIVNIINLIILYMVSKTIGTNIFLDLLSRDSSIQYALIYGCIVGGSIGWVVYDYITQS